APARRDHGRGRRRGPRGQEPQGTAARDPADDRRQARPGQGAGDHRQGHRSPEPAAGAGPVMNQAGNLAYDVFVNDPPPQDGFLPNGEPKRFSPMASTLIYGLKDAVLTDPGMTEDQARALGDWVVAKGRNVTDIFITHAHGDHFFAAGLLAERFGARVVATAGTIALMQGSVATRPQLWDKLYPGLIPPSPVTAVPVPGDRFTLEGHDLVMVDVGHGDADDNSVRHVPDMALVVAG